ncbi:MAG TPA: hypothetical protein VMN79_14475 [Casimicrobiaceae bacterium]|nr:hypothetical protein [Casimicrobiaceae bacterium]
MRTLIVEPHADDAFLSLGHTLCTRAPSEEVAVLTLYVQDARRIDEGGAYAKSIGAKGYFYAPSPERIAEALESTLRQFAPDLVLSPFGIQHPDHLAARACVDARGFPRVRYYLDVPYYVRPKNAAAIQAALAQCAYRVVSIGSPQPEKWKALPIFQSQAKFFRLNPPETLRAPEIVLERTP